MKIKFPKIGMRNIKTALAVTITILLSHFFKMEYPFYAAIAVVITMQASVTASYKIGKERMLGTAVGAIVGLICALISPGTAILCGLGIVVIIYICNLCKWNKSITIAGIVFLAIMINLGDRSPLTYSVNRLLDTFLGIIIALLVNYFIFPPNHKDKMYKNYYIILNKVFFLTQDKFCNKNNIDLSTLYIDIKNFEESINTYISESKIKHEENIEIDKLKTILEIYKNIGINLKTIQTLDNSINLNKDNCLLIKKLFNINLNYDSNINIDGINNDLAIIYNYHANEVFKNLILLKNYNHS